MPQGNSFSGAPCAKQKEGGKAETRVTVRAKLNSNRRRLSNKSSRGVSRGIRREGSWNCLLIVLEMPREATSYCVIVIVIITYFLDKREGLG